MVWLGFANPQPQVRVLSVHHSQNCPKNWDFKFQARSVAGPPDQADRWEPDAAQCHSEIFMSSCQQWATHFQIPRLGPGMAGRRTANTTLRVIKTRGPGGRRPSRHPGEYHDGCNPRDELCVTVRRREEEDSGSPHWLFRLYVRLFQPTPKSWSISHTDLLRLETQSSHSHPLLQRGNHKDSLVLKKPHAHDVKSPQIF